MARKPGVDVEYNPAVHIEESREYKPQRLDRTRIRRASLNLLHNGLAPKPASISSGFGSWPIPTLFSSDIIHQLGQDKPRGEALIVQTDPFRTSHGHEFLELARSLRRNTGIFQLGCNSMTQSFGQVETPTADDTCGAQEQCLHFG